MCVMRALKHVCVCVCNWAVMKMPSSKWMCPWWQGWNVRFKPVEVAWGKGTGGRGWRGAAVCRGWEAIFRLEPASQSMVAASKDRWLSDPAGLGRVPEPVCPTCSWQPHIETHWPRSLGGSSIKHILPTLTWLTGCVTPKSIKTGFLQSFKNIYLLFDKNKNSIFLCLLI